MSKRLEILKNSLEKKEGIFNEKIQNHFDTVREANGQPLNDKRNGRRTLDKWEKQNDSIRATKESIEKTKRAIEIEESKIANVSSFCIPEFLKPFLESGVIAQWRKYPNRFFVKGVDKGRIIWNSEKNFLGYSFLSEIPKDQYPIFRDVFNEINRKFKETLD